MTDKWILHIETATSVCSVGLSKGEELIALKEQDEDKSHGSVLTVFMKEVMEEAKIDASQIDAVAVSKGPGSYTGLRIGVSVCKGFAYARSIPVIGVSTLQAMAIGARENEKILKLKSNNPNLLLCPMIDARRMEVFSAIYNYDGSIHSPITANIIDEKSFVELMNEQAIAFFGNGAAKTKKLITHNRAHIIENIVPSAKNMIPLALKMYQKKEFEDTAYFEPYYLKDFVATTPKKKVL